ncbi:MAG: 3-deoxy-7-phosphoheptulonate synthase class II [Agitococcus sp.]|nr:3-deoxy-7-phosphoheptulonate synthase class II [Agitococcus sp.]
MTQQLSWHPASWRNHSALQQPNYPDQSALQSVQMELGKLPPLVTSYEIIALKNHIAMAQEGKSFLLQGGDCAENFNDCESGLISNRLKVLLQMSLVLVHGLRKPVVRVGRFAGQYAKPRSADLETIGDVTLPSYRGDFINGPEFTELARIPDPRRMVKGHARSAMTMNFVRSLIDGGFADLHHPEYWDLGWVKQSPQSEQYHKLVQSVGDAVRFMETISGEKAHVVNRTDFYTSHEALLLPYEEAVTRQVPRQKGWFNLSTHYPWIGMRTAQLDGAHVEYFSGIENPIGVKISASVTDDQIKQLCEKLNPKNEPGRLTLIHRLGATNVEKHLPRLIKAVQAVGVRVLWVCDPMHGNTESTSNGYKTRRFDNIKSELELSFDVHASENSHLGGAHLELTGENVTECLGGARDLVESDLERAYLSSVDPRLNYEQSLEIAMSIVHKHRSLNQ